MTNPKVTESEILESFADIVARSLRLERQRVTADAYLSDLGAESLDLLEITMETEDEFAILMPQKDILQVAQEIFGPGVLVHEGRLTEQGAVLLQRRMPEFGGSVVVGMSVAEVGRLFQRIGTWVRLIHGLIQHSPTACPSCAGPLPKPVAGRMRCQACAIEVDLPAGDDLNRRWVEEYHRVGHEVVSGEGAQVA
ncbi:MAG TPA: phosphopantetheine-binding protein [Vicinamibacterales bacterium]